MSAKLTLKCKGRTYPALFFILFGLVFVRYCYYGFTYWQQLDDYIQYHNYTAYNPDLSVLIDKLGLLSSRPLAGLSDLYIWSRFYGCMIVAVALISAMYAASAVFFHRVFSKLFGTGWLFFAVYELLPLGFEGTYWVSASSRIVVGLFFASISLLFFDKWCEEGKPLHLAVFALSQLAAFCFYEQIVLLSGAATLVVMLCHSRGKGKRPLWGLLMFAGAAVYMVITKLAASGVYGSRTELFLPWQENWWKDCVLPAGGQVSEVFGTGMLATVGRGLKRGLMLLVSEPNIIYCAVILLLCAALFFVIKSVRRESVRFWAELLAGLFLAVVPLALFFVIRNPWFGVRNAVPSFLGLALMADALFDLIFGRLPKARTVQAAVVSLACLLCCIASVSELHDYRETTVADKQIAKTAAETVMADGWVEGRTIWILNVDASYAENANFYFHEHGYGVTSSDWALTGAIESYAGRADLPVISPISKFRAVPTDGGFDPATSFCYFYNDGEILKATLTEEASGEWIIKDSSGGILGALTTTGGAFQLVI